MSMKIANTLVLLLACNLAHAMDGVFDRSAEIDQYIAQLDRSTSNQQLITVSRAIYISGIGEERLAKAISDRLLRDLPKLTSFDDSDQYGAWMVKALASTGDPIAKTTITQVQRTTTVSRIKEACKDQIEKIDWQHRKNEIMTSRRNYNQGDDMRVAQLLNLLQSDDYSLKQDAAYRMSWDKTLDARLMAEIATQLEAFANKGATSDDKAELSAMSHYAKMLGYSNNKQYVPLLQSLATTKTPNVVRKHAIKSLQEL